MNSVQGLLFNDQICNLSEKNKAYNIEKTKINLSNFRNERIFL